MPDNQYYVYILTTDKNTALYTGVTHDLVKRIFQHKNKMVGGFTARYHVHKLVYFEICNDILSAIEREKQIKSWMRKKKFAMINAFNPGWHDLYDDFG